MKRKSVFVCIITLLCIIVSIVFIANLQSDRLGKKYLDDILIISDDGEHSIIVKEWGTIGGTGADFYYLKDSFIFRNKVKIGDTIAKDSCYPFRDKNYILTWEDNSIIISFFCGRESQSIDDPTTWDKKEFIFPSDS